MVFLNIAISLADWFYKAYFIRLLYICFLSVIYYNLSMHIISGYKKNKKIIAPKRDFRPTQSKVREALFNIIEVKDKIFLDLCSGSGAIGFEALSRGAKYCVFAEIDREAIQNIFINAKNIFENESEKYKIKRIAAEDYAKRTNEKFDIIYFDPPYNSKIYETVISLIIERNLLNENGYLIVESSYKYYKKILENYKYDLEYEIKIYGENVLIIFKNIN